LFFVSFRIVFSDNTRVRIFFFCRAKRKFFFQNLTLGYMIKTLNQIIFFFLHQNQNIFFSNIGNQNIFFRKKTIPPFKLNGRSLTHVLNKIGHYLNLTNYQPVFGHAWLLWQWNWYSWVCSTLIHVRTILELNWPLSKFWPISSQYSFTHRCYGNETYVAEFAVL
jgi:hypothetical protein